MFLESESKKWKYSIFITDNSIWFSILDSAIVECKYYTNILGQLTANTKNDVRSKTPCDKLAQNIPNNASRNELSTVMPAVPCIVL